MESNKRVNAGSELLVSQSEMGNELLASAISGRAPASRLDSIEIPVGWTNEQVNKALWVNTSPGQNPACSAPLRWSEENVLDETNATHLWILHRAIELLRDPSLPNPPVTQQIADFLNFSTAPDPHPANPQFPWPRNTIFHDALVKGLYDADHQNPWFNSASWQSHFFDTFPNASYSSATLTCNSPQLNRADLFARYAMRLAYNAFYPHVQQNPDNPDYRYMIECFYHIGVALHYFTDMTQPMHAHNYPNVVGGANDRFHEAFETQAQAYINTHPTALIVNPRDLTDRNCFHFGGDPSGQGPGDGIVAWVYAASQGIGCANYELALVDQNGAKWALAPDAQGNHPLPPYIQHNYTLDHFYFYPVIGPRPAGCNTWQDACVPVYNSTLTAAQQATAGLLTGIFANWFPYLLWKDGPARQQPRNLSDLPIIPQNPVAIGCQTVYAYQGGDVALSIYTGRPDPNAAVVPNSAVHLPLLGNYGLTVSQNPNFPAAPGECMPACTTCDFQFGLPRLGCGGTIIPGQYTSQGSSVVGCTGGVQIDLEKLWEEVLAEAQQLAEQTAGQRSPIECVRGIGPILGERLREKGVMWANQFAQMDPRVAASILGISIDCAAELVQKAKAKDFDKS